MRQCPVKQQRAYGGGGGGATKESSLPAPEEHCYLSPRKAKKVHFAAEGNTGAWGLWGEGAQ